jgi:hypothetical protein
VLGLAEAKKYQALITMSGEMDCSRIGCLYCSMGVQYIGGGTPLGPAARGGASNGAGPGVAATGEAATLMGRLHLYRIGGAEPLVLYNIF